MNIWSKAWIKSVVAHLVIAILVVGVSYLSFNKNSVAKKGVTMHLGGGLGGHGQGGRFKTLQNGTSTPTKNSLTTEKISDAKRSALSKKRNKHKSKPISTLRETLSGVDDAIEQDYDDVDEDNISDDNASLGTLGSNGLGTADSGMSYGNGGSGNGYGNGSGPFSGTGFYANGDGTYTATSPDGIDYNILSEVYPSYPQEAKESHYTRTVIVETKFRVGLQGQIENIQILNNPPNLGFKEATIRALRQWKFSPITYKGYPLKVEFTKRFRFEAN